MSMCVKRPTAWEFGNPLSRNRFRIWNGGWGTALFERVGRRVVLTHAGRAFQRRVERLMVDLSDARQELEQLANLQTGRLVVGVAHTVNSFLVPRIVQEFHRKYPGVILQVEDLVAEELEADLKSGRLDAGMSFRPSVASDDLEFESILKQELQLVIRAGSHPEWGELVNLINIALLPLAALPRRFYTRRLVDQAFEKIGKKPNVCVEMSSISGILETVQTSELGVILPAMAVPDLCTGVRFISITNPTSVCEIGLLWRSGRSELAIRKEFANVVRGLIKSYRR